MSTTMKTPVDVFGHSISKEKRYHQLIDVCRSVKLAEPRRGCSGTCRPQPPTFTQIERSHQSNIRLLTVYISFLLAVYAENYIVDLGLFFFLKNDSENWADKSER